MKLSGSTSYNSRGAFGIVHRVEGHGKIWACKIVKKKQGSPSAYEQLMREVTVMKVVSHKNIVALKEVYETPKKLALVMEYCGGGELVKTLRKRGVIKQLEIQTIIRQLIDAVTYLHKHGIVHRDIKPENILLSSDSPLVPYDIKVSDFGLACFADSVNRVEHIAGTPMYMAPEVIHNLGYNHQCDIWSIGVMLYLLYLQSH
ncbi:kinase-like domain-containing protein [Gorgonomyces haynaldii]|nr:kinase-like domain-containing protein [Gorgonomyces haynaldii]